jgi:hypothetical protein
MGQARTNARRRKQAVQNMNHLSPKKRPNYRKTHTSSVGESIAAARRAAASEARRAVKKK